MDVFPRFVRSKFCERVVTKYQKDTGVLVFKETQQYPYTDKSFQNYFVTDSDFAFMKRLSVDSFDWQLMGSLTSSLNSYFSNRNVNLF